MIITLSELIEYVEPNLLFWITRDIRDKRIWGAQGTPITSLQGTTTNPAEQKKYDWELRIREHKEEK